MAHICEGLTHRHHSFQHYSDPTAILAAADQDEIGWAATMEGRLSRSWRPIQDDYYRQIRSRRTSQRWMILTVEALWTLTHSIWIARCNTVKTMERAAELHCTQSTIDSQIRSLYANYRPDNYMANDRYLFEDKSMEARLATQYDEKEIWLQAVSWADETAKDDRQNEHSQMRNTMQAWLQSG